MKKTLLFSLLVAGMLTLASCGNAPKEETAGKHNIQLTKVTDYLYETTLDYDFEIADAQALYQKYKPHMGGCSSVSIGNLRGRNLDWIYGTGVEVVVRTPKTDKRHASLGIASLVNVSEEEANDGQNQEGCEMLPWITVDGINDAGVCVNVNVVNYQELGPWEMKTETEDGDINNILKGKDNKYFEHIKNLMVNRKQRDRNVPDNLWETIHTTIYNYKERSLQVNVHEGTIYYDYKL